MNKNEGIILQTCAAPSAERGVFTLDHSSFYRFVKACVTQTWLRYLAQVLG